MFAQVPMIPSWTSSWAAFARLLCVALLSRWSGVWCAPCVGPHARVALPPFQPLPRGRQGWAGGSATPFLTVDDAPAYAWVRSWPQSDRAVLRPGHAPAYAPHAVCHLTPTPPRHLLRGVLGLQAAGAGFLRVLPRHAGFPWRAQPMAWPLMTAHPWCPRASRTSGWAPYGVPSRCPAPLASGAPATEAGFAGTACRRAVCAPDGS